MFNGYFEQDCAGYGADILLQYGARYPLPELYRLYKQAGMDGHGEEGSDWIFTECVKDYVNNKFWIDPEELPSLQLINPDDFVIGEVQDNR